MRVLILTPAPAGSRSGNRVTALRWAGILRALGHRVVIEQRYRSGTSDLLVALHAKHSGPSVERFKRRHPDKPVIVALTGTDLYRDLPRDRRARRSIERADRLIVLQPLALLRLPAAARAKARVVYQSVRGAGRPRGVSVRSLKPSERKGRSPIREEQGVFEVCVLGHLRAVKDPFRAALAARLLPPHSRIAVTQIGAALTSSMADRARAEAARNPRYAWRGEKPRPGALRALARCRLLVVTSRMEGGANVVSEALALGVPVVSARIPGSVGLLGRDYPGYYPPGNTRGLTRLLLRTETDSVFYESLRRRCACLAPLVAPERERRSWKNLLAEL